VSDKRVERRLAAILSADVAGYSRLMGQDEAGTLARLKGLRRELIDPKIAEHKGRIVKTTGDGILVEFPSVVAAVACAVAVQRGMVELNADFPEDQRIEFRVGIHQGDIIVEDGDIFGDGVNVAARLEALAEPGGVCVSGRVQEDAAGRLDLVFKDAGEQQLRNIARPVRAYHVALDRRTHDAPTALPLPDKPSVAVLPFQNMSGDPEQEYFADGMVEEVTTALSRIRSLFVIARNSAFTYKGRAVDVRQVGRELGVRYVLEGSVRKAGSRVRITGQLVEAATGTHLWADRFDGALEDVFDLQDRMTASVVAAIEPTVRVAEIQRAKRKPAENLQAYDLLLRALALLYGRTQIGLAEATRLLQQAVAADPTYAPSLAYLAYCQWKAVTQSLIDRGNPAIAEMIQLVQSALALDPNDPEILTIAGEITARIGGDLSGGIALLNRALELSPNNAAALAEAAGLQAWSGDTAAAISLLDRSARHNPLDWNYRVCSVYMITYFVAGEYERAIEWSAKTLQEMPHSTVALRWRAASLGQLGRLEEGRHVVQRLLVLVPNFTITRFRQLIGNYTFFKTPAVADALYEGLRRCGVPE
jgi:adenylate cyclase